MASAGAALNWDAAESKIDRFNKPPQLMGAQTYGFQGFPEMHMLEPKRPLRHQASADITTDVNRYFRKDSPPEWLPQQGRQQSPPRQRTPPRQENDFNQPQMHSPPPQFQGTLSPRYNDQQSSRRKTPVIRDPLGELSQYEKQKKIEEHYQAEEDLKMAQQRREAQKMAKIEEQRRVRELQDSYKPWGRPGGGAPNRPRFGDENRGMDGIRSSMERRDDRKEAIEESLHEHHLRREQRAKAAQDLLRTQENEIEDLRRNLARLERDRQFDNTSRGPRVESRTDKMEMLEDQAKQLKHVQEELSRLRAQDDNYPSGRGGPGPDYNARAHSEPQTDRPYRRNRDRDMWGESKPSYPDYLNVSPRRAPVGQLYNKESTYKKDFDLPTVRHGNRNLGNPNAEPWEPFSPFGLEGGGAPMVDQSGQRKTRIAGSMGILGREHSDSARARKGRSHKKEMLDAITEQAARDRARREEEERYRRQEFTELTDVMRHQKVGYPKVKYNGEMDHNPKQQMFEINTIKNPREQKQLYDYLTKQVNEKYMSNQLSNMEGRRQAIEHYKTQDRFFGRRGGGNIKGDDLRKVNLERAIHNPTSTSRYYNKVRLDEENSPTEILDKFKPRITINSTHKNLYEFPEGNLKGRQLFY